MRTKLIIDDIFLDKSVRHFRGHLDDEAYKSKCDQLSFMDIACGVAAYTGILVELPDVFYVDWRLSPILRKHISHISRTVLKYTDYEKALFDDSELDIIPDDAISDICENNSTTIEGVLAHSTEARFHKSEFLVIEASDFIDDQESAIVIADDRAYTFANNRANMILVRRDNSTTNMPSDIKWINIDDIMMRIIGLEE